MVDNGASITPPPIEKYGFVEGQVKAGIGKSTVQLEGATIIAYKGYLGGVLQPVDSTTTASDGSYELVLTPGEYKIEVSKGSQYSVESQWVNVTDNIRFYSPTLEIYDSKNKGIVKGRVSNAFTGTGVSDITINIRRGLNVHDGEISTSMKTLSSGNYELSMDPGDYTAEVSGEGYIKTFFSLYCQPDTTRDDQNCDITPILIDGQTRIVLTWGQTPSDLDSHLTGPSVDGGRFHTYYSNKEYTVSGTKFADLDLDDTSSFGPETTTIYKQQDGAYRFTVHDYSNLGSTSSTELSDSGATVKVYRGDTLIALYNVPSNQEGTVWTVFELDGNTITPINKMSYESDPGNVGVSALRTSLVLTTIDEDSTSVQTDVYQDERDEPNPPNSDSDEDMLINLPPKNNLK